MFIHAKGMGPSMNYAEIKYCDIANGAGVRTSLFVSGCRHHCPGCFNPGTWDFSAGKPFTLAVEEEIFESLEPSYVVGLTLLGGEPMEPENQAVLAGFLERLHRRHPSKTVWLYTGFTWDDIVGGQSRAHTKDAPRILAQLDVLVDGPFVLEKKNLMLRFRGSSNQRIIDVPRSLEAGKVCLWEDDPVFVDHRW